MCNTSEGRIDQTSNEMCNTSEGDMYAKSQLTSQVLGILQRVPHTKAARIANSRIVLDPLLTKQPEDQRGIYRP